MKHIRLTKTGKIVFCCILAGAAGLGCYKLIPAKTAESDAENTASASSAASTHTPVPTATPSPTPSAATKQTVSSDLKQLITEYLTANQIDTDSVGIYVHDFTSDGEYTLNEDQYFIAASTYKLPLAVYYYEKVNSGEYSLSDIASLTIYSDVEESDTSSDTTAAAPAAAAPDASASAGTSAAPVVPTPTPVPATPEPTIYSDTIENLLHKMILYSDNTAAEALYEHMGGWMTFKTATAAYSDGTYSEDNTFTPSYMNDLLSYIYQHKSSFPTLLSDMLASEPDAYLNMNIGDLMMQKYGDYGGALNAVGLSSTGHPYSIAVYTYGLYNGTSVIGDINEICYNYFNK